MMEYEDEPIRGLPGRLPPGEEILWQGAPDWRVLARSAFHTRWIAAYFAALTLYGIATGSLLGAGITALAGIACLALLAVLSWAIARTTVYTLTNKRIVLRIGVALTTCFNVPLKLMTSAEIRPLDRGHGDIALAIDQGRIGYLLLWPHARPWRLKDPQPMLRALPEADRVAELLVKARAAVSPIAKAEPAPVKTGAPAPQAAAAPLGAAA